MIIISSVFFRVFTNGFARGIALFPFILLNSKDLKNNKTIINHERIHLKQQSELLVIPFYIWYLVEFIIRFSQHYNFRKAYENISFEREAFTNDKNLEYLSTRKYWSFTRYLKLK